MKYILRTENLCKNFKKEEALKNISINVRENSIYGLLGPNGAGKSTLLKLVTGMMKPTSGEILFKENLFEKKDLWEIGALIENPAIYPNLTARENLDKLRSEEHTFELQSRFDLVCRLLLE